MARLHRAAGLNEWLLDKDDKGSEDVAKTAGGLARMNELHQKLFSERWYQLVVPFLLVLAPIVYGALSLGLSEQHPVISGCVCGLGRDSYGISGFNTPVNVSQCVEANGQRVTLVVPGYFHLEGAKFSVLFYGVVFFYVGSLAFLMRHLWLWARLAQRLLPFGVVLTGTKWAMGSICVSSVFAVFGLTYLEVTLQSLAYDVALDKPLGACDNGPGFSDNQLYAESSIATDGMAAVNPMTYVRKALPLMLQFTGLYGFLYARWGNLFADVNFPALLLDRRRSAILGQLGRATYKVKYADVSKTIKARWILARLRERPFAGMTASDTHYPPLKLLFFIGFRCSRGYLSTPRRFLEGASADEVADVVAALHRRDRLVLLDGAEEPAADAYDDNELEVGTGAETPPAVE